MQYKELRSTLEMLPARPGKRAAVTGLDFNATAELLAAGGAGPNIQLHNYAAVLAAGTKCVSGQAVIYILPNSIHNRRYISVLCLSDSILCRSLPPLSIEQV